MRYWQPLMVGGFRSLFAAENPDIIILDLMLPEIDGLEVARTICKTSNVPIIVPSAKDTEFDKVIGLEIRGGWLCNQTLLESGIASACESLVASFWVCGWSLSLKMRLIMKLSLVIFTFFQMPSWFKRQQRIGLDPSRIWIALSPCDPCRSRMTREHLLETVWGYDYFGDVRTVDVTVRRLRENRGHTGTSRIYLDPPWVSDIIWETMIDQLKQFCNVVELCLCSDYGWVYHCGSLALLENRRDNIKPRQLNAKIKDLIAGDYSEVVDMQGKSRTDGYDQ